MTEKDIEIVIEKETPEKKKRKETRNQQIYTLQKN